MAAVNHGTPVRGSIKGGANPLTFLSRARAAREEVHDHRNDGEKQQDVN